MVGRAALALCLGCGLATQAGADEIDLKAWAAGLPAHFSVSGVKVEPTYHAAIDIGRDGDRIAVLGGAPAWMERSLEAVKIGPGGAIGHDVCPPGMRCDDAARPAGFLATALLVSLARSGGLQGNGETRAFGNWTVVCIDAEKLGVARPILDPCFEIGTGAAIAQKHRLSGRFDGPSLDPASVRFNPEARGLPLNPKDKAS